jgi:3-oxoacyl-[acyl-carrier protein] reductase
MDLELKGKIALVTASTGGIGFAIAHRLAQEGAVVVVNGRSTETVESACRQIQAYVPDAQLQPLVADNGTSAGCRTTVESFPEIEILVNNLGIYEVSDFFTTSDAQWQHLFEVNVLSGVRLSRHYLKSMLGSGAGRIVFVSSESAMNPAPEMAHYSATKLMELSVARSLAELTKGTRVTVNSVLPGSTRTAGVEKFIQDVFPGTDYDLAEKRFMAENRPTSLIGRLILPEEIASLVAFVCSPLSSGINGACLRVDGGLIRSAV